MFLAEIRGIDGKNRGGRVGRHSGSRVSVLANPSIMLEIIDVSPSGPGGTVFGNL